MLKVGLDLGTGFVKCMSDYGSVRFPSVYVKRIHGSWSNTSAEAVGYDAIKMINTLGTSTIRPIQKGKPDPKYHKQVELLIKESMNQIYKSAKKEIPSNEQFKIAVGLPYHAFNNKETIARLVKRALNVEECKVRPQAAGTLVDLEQDTGMVVSIGQGTTEIVVIDKLEVIDGDSSQWASDFITKKIGKFAHIDVSNLYINQDICKKYSKILVENLVREIYEIAENYNNQYPIAISGGGLLIPGVKDELLENLKQFKIMIPENPVMSNAIGLYKMLQPQA